MTVTGPCRGWDFRGAKSSPSYDENELDHRRNFKSKLRKNVPLAGAFLARRARNPVSYRRVYVGIHSQSEETPMPERTAQGGVVETAKEARAGERGPSMLIVLTVSTVAVAVIFMALWYFLPG